MVNRHIAEQKFEALLARSGVIAMHLKSQGAACSQSVLLRVLRNGKPLMATRHEAIEALQDADFRTTLSNQIRQANQHLARSSSPGEEIERFLLSD